MSLSYSYIDWKYPLAPPPFKVNGGLYTGEAAKGPWGNYPVLPEPNELAKNLLTANPPPNAEKIPTTYHREGNNNVTFPNHVLYNNNYPQLICRK
jgi:hypothetical protein